MFSQTTCVSDKLKDLKVKLDMSCTFELWTPQVYPKIRKSYFEMDRLKFDNRSQELLSLNNYMVELNSESISRFQVPRLN